MKIQKQYIPLLIAILLPVLFVAVVVGSIYLPQFQEEPQYDFLYVQEGSGRPTVERGWVEVDEGVVTYYERSEDGARVPAEVEDPVTLYYHDVTENRSRELSLSEAQEYTLDPSHRSPDGFEVICGSRNEPLSFFFGGSRDCRRQVIARGASSRELELEVGQSEYWYGFRFLGWVIEDNNE